MTIFNIAVIYFSIGVIWSALFEYLIYITKSDLGNTSNGHRLFWLTLWPWCIVKFLIGFFK